MTRYLMTTGMLVAILAVFLLMRNMNNKRIKYIILIAPFVLGGLSYFSIILLTKDMPTYACDGAAILGIFASFMLLGVGLLLNLVNMLHWALKYNKRF